MRTLLSLERMIVGMRLRLMGILLLGCTPAVFCSDGPRESPADYVIRLEAKVEESPPVIHLIWDGGRAKDTISYTVYRKTPEDTHWGLGKLLEPTSREYRDEDVEVGREYEYQVERNASTHSAYGYLCGGIRISPIHVRGRILLLVEKELEPAIEKELNQTELDLTGEGWTVSRMSLSKSLPPPAVKDLIRNESIRVKDPLRAVWILGHISVPYSGNMDPDGHVQHQGAWPADVYYATFKGEWEDRVVDNQSSSDPRNWNVPGDGKMDPSEYPSRIEFPVGRVDLSRMPGKKGWFRRSTFPSEVEMTRNYLVKDHRYRTAQFPVPDRATVFDGFGVLNGEAFAGNAWRNFTPFFGHQSVRQLEKGESWLETLSVQSSKWAYACGGGAFQSMDGLKGGGQEKLGSSVDVVEADIRVPFVMMYGSWFIDWDTEDNLLRAVLATPTMGLVALQAGRPHLFLHSMAMGNTIGNGLQITQNNAWDGLYRNQKNLFANQIHLALMGDPTLRLYVTPPPGQLEVIRGKDFNILKWNPPSTPVEGYYIFRSAHRSGPYELMNSQPQKDLTWKDVNPLTGTTYYMVQSVLLQTNGSGSFYNTSTGMIISSEP